MEIEAYLEADHRRLDALLDKATAHNEIDRETYDLFREGLLKHIGIEEKLLLPRAQKMSGKTVERAAKLRLDHGAIAALLVLDPAPNVIHALRTILDAHNKIEEGPDGVYAECEGFLADESMSLMEEIRRFPAVPLARRIQGEALRLAAQRCLLRAGFPSTLLE